MEIYALSLKGANRSGLIEDYIQRISSELILNNGPQAFACVIPLKYHSQCAIGCGKMILCDSGTGCGSCSSCAEWTKDSHPDIFFLGKPDEPPGIEECRKLWGELSLRPVAANTRLGVLMAAHRLSIPAANSLLKITEETPPSARIMLLLEEDSMLPTLRSRLRVFRFFHDDSKEVVQTRVPIGMAECFKWMGKTRKSSPQELAAELECWARCSVSENDYERASRLDLICTLARKGKLTVPMIHDLALAGLEGDAAFEELFDDLW